MTNSVENTSTRADIAPPKPVYSRKRPFWAKLTKHERLTKPGSGKDTRHLVFELEGSGLSYTPGDSLGAYGSNPPALVDELIRLLKFDPDTPLQDADGDITTLRNSLLRDYTLNRANRKILTGLAERIPQGEQRNRIMELTANNDLLCEYVDTRDYVDVIREFDQAKFDSVAAFLTQLSPAAPRLYSIASAPAAHPGEAHLCVTVVRYETHGRPKKGFASGFLADHADMFVQAVPVYLQESRSFRLPGDKTRDIIMVGPGTGIAPFRAFIEQRALDGASGRNWLFFGEQHRATDFLYEDELLAWQDRGILHRLDLAFSRDQAHKIYVQDRMIERGKELWNWITGGACLYVCGDARNMAKGVHQALITLAQEHGGMTPEPAADYVNVTLMKTEKRYLRDVY
jgi:sulfite reductase (NADPH) flavoprotein alpha-component